MEIMKDNIMSPYPTKSRKDHYCSPVNSTSEKSCKCFQDNKDWKERFDEFIEHYDFDGGSGIQDCTPAYVESKWDELEFATVGEFATTVHFNDREYTLIRGLGRNVYD